MWINFVDSYRASLCTWAWVYSIHHENTQLLKCVHFNTNNILLVCFVYSWPKEVDLPAPPTLWAWHKLSQYRKKKYNLKEKSSSLHFIKCFLLWFFTGSTKERDWQTRRILSAYKYLSSSSEPCLMYKGN